tara:strand:- start:326 stop:547 length:222 start_codon:yes stop_codon:yes gene_type:complete
MLYKIGYVLVMMATSVYDCNVGNILKQSPQSSPSTQKSDSDFYAITDVDILQEAALLSEMIENNSFPRVKREF